MDNVIKLKPEPTFEDFYKACPKRVGKAKTRVLWDKITAPGGTTTRSLIKDSGQYVELHLEATPEQLLKAVKLYAKEQFVVVSDKYVISKYCLHPYTFLNSGRFEDYLEEN